MLREHYFVIGILFFCIQACSERVICPAYQSAFIHDKGVLERHFSYFGQDTMPKIMEASKDKFLIIEPVSYRKKLRSLQTIPMRDVYPQKDDSLAFDNDFYLAEREVFDSTAVISVSNVKADSVYMISLKKEKFNIDQELYLWYLRQHLVYPDVRLGKQNSAKREKTEAREKKKKRGISGFFRNIFKKKDKPDKTEKTVFDVETSATELEKDEPKEKRGLFRKKKKDKDVSDDQEAAPEEETEEQVPPPAEQNNGDDNF